MAVHITARSGDGQNVRIIKKMYEAGFSLTFKSDFILTPYIGGQTPILEAARGGNLEVLEYIIKHHPDGVNSLKEKDNRGQTPTHLAALSKHVEVLKYITENDSELLKEKNNIGKTPNDEVDDSISFKP